MEPILTVVEDGRLELDNNLIENAVRPVVLGRKNWLFAGSHNSARQRALVYSLLGTAKMHNIEPWLYLKDVLTRIFNTLGQCVFQRIKNNLDAGLHTLHWNGVNSAGHALSSGIYLIQVRTATRVQTIKSILVR